LTVTMNKIASDKPCPKTLPCISIYWKPTTGRL
jgi:hypothetical protein